LRNLKGPASSFSSKGSLAFCGQEAVAPFTVSCKVTGSCKGSNGIKHPPATNFSNVLLEMTLSSAPESAMTGISRSAPSIPCKLPGILPELFCCGVRREVPPALAGDPAPLILLYRDCERVIGPEVPLDVCDPDFLSKLAFFKDFISSSEVVGQSFMKCLEVQRSLRHVGSSRVLSLGSFPTEPAPLVFDIAFVLVLEIFRPF
jgi:hypothetical protein